MTQSCRQLEHAFEVAKAMQDLAYEAGDRGLAVPGCHRRTGKKLTMLSSDLLDDDAVDHIHNAFATVCHGFDQVIDLLNGELGWIFPRLMPLDPDVLIGGA